MRHLKNTDLLFVLTNWYFLVILMMSDVGYFCNICSLELFNYNYCLSHVNET